MKYLTIIQARSSSSRLPRKSLMKINEIPLIKLCALRAMNDFSDLIVATSNETSDDDLYNLLKSNNINVYRGSLNNVLSRFIDIINHNNLEDDDVVIRLTGDNPIVDKHFLKILKQAWDSGSYDYMSGEPENMNSTNWPKGLSAEFVKTSHLRESYDIDKTPENLEHVTKYIRENVKSKAFGDEVTSLKFKKKYFLGIDTLDDYNRLKMIFAKVDPEDTFMNIIETIDEKIMEEFDKEGFLIIRDFFRGPIIDDCYNEIFENNDKVVADLIDISKSKNMTERNLLLKIII